MLTDNGVQFTSRRQDIYDSQHIFDRVCDEHDIEHRLTKVNHPWTNGQVERMNRTIKDATVKRYHYDSHDQLRTHLHLFVDAYNHARRLKTLRGLTPTEFILNAWTKEPNRFRIDPSHLIPGPYSPRNAANGGLDQASSTPGWPISSAAAPRAARTDCSSCESCANAVTRAARGRSTNGCRVDGRRSRSPRRDAGVTPFPA